MKIGVYFRRDSGKQKWYRYKLDKSKSKSTKLTNNKTIRDDKKKRCQNGRIKQRVNKTKNKKENKNKLKNKFTLFLYINERYMNRGEVSIGGIKKGSEIIKNFIWKKFKNLHKYIMLWWWGAQMASKYTYKYIL